MKRTKKRHSITKLPPALTFALLVLAFGTGACLVPTLIFVCAPLLGFWWWVLLLIYFIALTAVVALLRHRREMERLRFALGDELFAEKFPKEWERMQKRGSDTFFVGALRKHAGGMFLASDRRSYAPRREVSKDAYGSDTFFVSTKKVSKEND